MSFTGVVVKAKHRWFEQLSFSFHATEKSCLAVGVGSDDWSVSKCLMMMLMILSKSINQYLLVSSTLDQKLELNHNFNPDS